MRRLGLLVVGLWVGLGWSSGASSNLIVNGDFEGNNAPWTFAGGGRFVFGPTDAGYGHGNTGHYAALESTPGTVTVAQALINELIIGGTYLLSWDVNLRDFAGHTDPTSDDTFRVYLDSLANPALFLGL